MHVRFARDVRRNWNVLVLPIDDTGSRRPQNHYRRTRGFTCRQRCDRRIGQGFCELPGEPRRQSLPGRRKQWGTGSWEWGVKREGGVLAVGEGRFWGFLRGSTYCSKLSPWVLNSRYRVGQGYHSGAVGAGAGEGLSAACDWFGLSKSWRAASAAKWFCGRGFLYFARAVCARYSSKLLCLCDLGFASCVGVPHSACKTHRFARRATEIVR
jgi:hypothetical protein